MSLIASIVCSECGKLYDDSTRRTCVGKCRHSICLSCKNSLTPPNCLICDEADAFKETVINHQHDNFMLEFQKSLSEADIEKFTKNLGHGPCSKCNIFTEKLRVCTKCTPFVASNGCGGWRLSLWLQGQNSFLKAKSSAICASCAIDYHDEHKIINLISIDGINGDFEIESYTRLWTVLRRNWNRDCEEGRTTSYVILPKMFALQWNFNARINENRKPTFENSLQLIKNPVCQPWKPQLEASLAEIQRLQKQFLDWKKADMMYLKRTYSFVEMHLRSSQDKKMQEEAEEMMKNYKLLPTDLLSQEEYDKYDKEAEEKLNNLSVEMAEKHPDQRADKDFLRAEVMKEEIIKAKESVIAADSKVKEYIHHITTRSSGILQKLHPSSAFLINQETLKSTLKYEKCQMKWLKAVVDQQMAYFMMYKCYESARFKDLYIKKFVELCERYEGFSPLIW